MYEKRGCLRFMLLEFIFDNFFGPKMDYFLCLVFALRRHMSNAICDFVLYLFHEYVGTFQF